jgi:hypothetical protein
LDYTVISFLLDDYPFDGSNHRAGISKGGQIDMQVIALIGIEVPTDHQSGRVYRFDGVTSDWSNTQTITMPESSSSPTPSPTAPIGTINTGPHMPETEPFPTSVLVVALVLLAVVSASVMFFRKHRKTANQRK